MNEKLERAALERGDRFSNLIENAIRGAVRQRLAEIVSEETTAAIQKIEAAIAGELDRLALAVLREYEVSSRKDMVIISVRKPGVPA